jgi:catechol 2,3-dioxygenase-like lactoylglutathione lyase family enzyme
VPLHRLAQVALTVPDLAASGAFYDAFGLVKSAGSTDTRAAYSSRDGGEQLVVQQAKHRSIQQITAEADDSDDLGRIAQRLLAAGHPVEMTGDGATATLVTTEPHARLRVVIRVAPRRGSAQPAPSDATNYPGHVARVNRPANAVMNSGPVRPSQLSHAVVGTPDQPATLAFFTDLIGFEISDQLPGIIAFTRCSESHHNLAIQLAPAPLLHHVAWEVDSVDEVARGGSNLILADPTRQMWGLGRHAIGSNWFWYLREPSGHYFEYTADIDRITSQDLYQPKEWAGHEFLFAAGSPPPAQFLEPEDMAELIAANS